MSEPEVNVWEWRMESEETVKQREERRAKQAAKLAGLHAGRRMFAMHPEDRTLDQEAEALQQKGPLRAAIELRSQQMRAISDANAQYWLYDRLRHALAERDALEAAYQTERDDRIRAEFREAALHRRLDRVLEHVAELELTVRTLQAGSAQAAPQPAAEPSPKPQTPKARSRKAR